MRIRRRNYEENMLRELGFLLLTTISNKWVDGQVENHGREEKN
jgi:hypothetical protein